MYCIAIPSRCLWPPGSTDQRPGTHGTSASTQGHETSYGVLPPTILPHNLSILSGKYKKISALCQAFSPASLIIPSSSREPARCPATGAPSAGPRPTPGSTEKGWSCLWSPARLPVRAPMGHLARLGRSGENGVVMTIAAPAVHARPSALHPTCHAQRPEHHARACKVGLLPLNALERTRGG
jgi:hypothetical protein